MMVLSSSIFPSVTYSSNPTLYTYSLFASLLWAVTVCFIALPTFPVLRRNVKLARRGMLTTGRYAGSYMVTFLTPDGKRIRFRSFIQPCNYIGRELLVIYDPGNPYIAEIASLYVLWKIPLSRLVMLGQSTAVILILRGMFSPFALLLSWFASEVVYFLLLSYFKWSIRLPA